MQDKYRIELLVDEHDCETCGSAYAEGYQIFLNDELVIDKKPIAHCFNLLTYPDWQAYQDVLRLVAPDLEIVCNFNQGEIEPDYD